MSAYMNMNGWNTPRTAIDPMGMSGQNGTQNREPQTPWWNTYGQGVEQGTPWGKDETTNKLLQLGFGGQADWSKFISSWAQPQFMSTLKDAYGMINPAGAASRYGAFKTASMNDATAQGSAQADHLRALGFSPAAQGGALVNSQNRAEEAANSFWQQNNDPYQMQLQKLGLLGQAGNSPSSSYYTQLLGLSNQQQKDPSFLQSTLGILGSLFGH